MRSVGYVKSPLVEDTDRFFSNTLWHSCPFTSIKDGTLEGHVLFDDFNSVEYKASATATLTDGLAPWAAFLDSGGTVDGGASNEHGEIIITCDADDTDSAGIYTGAGNAGAWEFIAPDTAVPHDIWFEARWKIGSITTGNYFVGFMQEGLDSSDGLLTDTANTYAAKDYVGFHVLEGDPDGLDFVYNNSSSSDIVGINAMDTMVADTYVKTGFHYSYRNPDAQMMRIYLNGQEQTTFVTKSVINGSNFPANNELLFGAVAKNSTSTAAVLTLDWVRIAQKVN